MQVAGEQYQSYPLHSVNIDFCFKLPHLTAQDSSGRVQERGTADPANSRFFIPDMDVLQHRSLAESSLRLPDDGLCSNFKADEVRVAPVGDACMALLPSGLTVNGKLMPCLCMLQALGKEADGKVLLHCCCSF